MRTTADRPRAGDRPEDWEAPGAALVPQCGHRPDVAVGARRRSSDECLYLRALLAEALPEASEPSSRTVGFGRDLMQLLFELLNGRRRSFSDLAHGRRLRPLGVEVSFRAPSGRSFGAGPLTS